MAVKNMIPEALAYGFMQRAYLAGVLSASALSIVGVFIVLRRMSNIGEGLSNIAFAGVSIGLVAGMAPLPAALAAVLVGVIVIRHLMGRKKVFGETAVQVLCSGGFALGVIVISSSSGFNAGLLGYLFGSLLSVSDSDILFIGLLAILTFLSVAFSSKHLAYIAFDEEGARAAGLPVNRLNMVLMLLVASSVVAGMRVVGILMVSSLLVVPGATAILIGKSFRMTLFLAVLFGVASVITGLTSAYYLNVAAGGAVVLAQVLFFLGVSVLSKRL